jgi:hypothetical protein
VADTGQGVTDVIYDAANGSAFIQGADNQTEVRLVSRSKLDIRQKETPRRPTRQGLPPSIKTLAILRTQRMANLW